MVSDPDAIEYPIAVMVRLDEEHFGLMHGVQGPGEPRAHVFLRLLREASMPPNTFLYYSKLPLFENEMRMGPLSPIAADNRGQKLMRQGWTVRVEVVDG